MTTYQNFTKNLDTILDQILSLSTICEETSSKLSNLNLVFYLNAPQPVNQSYVQTITSLGMLSKTLTQSTSNAYYIKRHIFKNISKLKNTYIKNKIYDPLFDPLLSQVMSQITEIQSSKQYFNTNKDPIFKFINESCKNKFEFTSVEISQSLNMAIQTVQYLEQLWDAISYEVPKQLDIVNKKEN